MNLLIDFHGIIKNSFSRAKEIERNSQTDSHLLSEEKDMLLYSSRRLSLLTETTKIPSFASFQKNEGQMLDAHPWNPDQSLRQ